MGNLRSVANAFSKFTDVEVSSDPDTIVGAEKVVLPGVGAFGDAMKNLEKAGLDKAIHEAVRKNRPFLGICLGYQLLFEKSFEAENIKGLSVLKGCVEKFNHNLKVPQIGWNIAVKNKKSTVFSDNLDGQYFYFVHSYYVKPEDEGLVLCKTDYAIEYASAIEYENIYGFQFHPEKSHSAGLKIIENFSSL